MKLKFIRIKHVKSVVDSFVPKGRSRKKSKSPKRARHKSSSRPPTRRNPKHMPIQSKGAGEVSLPDHQFKLDLVKSKTSEIFGDQEEYLQFSLRITEDIMKNDLYTNDQMRQVLNSHYEANKGRLCQDKMVTTMLELCKELNISFYECDPTSRAVLQSPPKPTYICESKEVQTVISVRNACECTKETNLPIESKSQSENVKVEEKSVNDFVTDEKAKVTIKEESTTKIINNDENLIQHKCLCGSPSCDSLACDAVSHNFEYVIEDKQEPEPEIVEEVDQPNIETIEEENTVGMDKCHCGNECCDKDRLFIFLDHYEKKLAHPKNIHEFGVSHYMTYIEPKKNCTTDLSIQTSQHNMPSKPKVLEPTETCNCKGGTPPINCLKEPNKPIGMGKICNASKETETVAFNCQQKSRSLNPFTSVTGIGTTPINCLKEPNKPIGMGKICNASKGTETVEFNCQQKSRSPNPCTCVTGIGTTPINRLKVPNKPTGMGKIYNASKGTETVEFNCQQKSRSPNLGNQQNDFIVFDGPVLIPKSTVRSVERLNKACKKCECCTNYFNQPRVEFIKSVQFPTQKHSAPNTNFSVSTEYMTNMVPERPKYEYTNKTDVLYQKNYDYDLTPEKDTLLYESNMKCENSLCCGSQSNRNRNLLLGDQYDNNCVEENERNKYTTFYPSIATQVTSMELLPNLEKKTLDTTEIPRQNPILPRQVSINLQPNTIEHQLAAVSSENNTIKHQLAAVSSQNHTIKHQLAAVSSENHTIKHQLTAVSSENHNMMADKSLSSKPNQSIQLVNDDLFKSVDSVPEICNTDSMDERIDMLRSEMEKYREAREDDIDIKSSGILPDAEEDMVDVQDRYDFKTTDAAIRGSVNPKPKPKVSINANKRNL